LAKWIQKASENTSVYQALQYRSWTFALICHTLPVIGLKFNYLFLCH